MAVPEWRRVLGGGARAQPGAPLPNAGPAPQRPAPAQRPTNPPPSPEQIAGIPQVGVDINGVAGNRGLGGELPQVNK